MAPRHFIVPAAPKLRAIPPLGSNWIHEIKFDGWRLQVHFHSKAVQFLSRTGKDITDRFRDIAGQFGRIAADDCVLDCEIVALDEEGRCDFAALHSRRSTAALCVRAFDLLALNGVDLRPLPLVTRRTRLRELVSKSRVRPLLYSESFTDPVGLLEEAERLGLEGIVSKDKTHAYISGSRCRWVKVKTFAWREANAGRSKLFENRRQA